VVDDDDGVEPDRLVGHVDHAGRPELHGADAT
jgi:hypothetical protein